MTRVVVTGGSGRLGQHVILHLLEHGYQVVNVDVKPPAASYNEWLCPFRSCNLSDYGQTFAALYGFDAVVHLAADPRPDSDHLSGATRFHNNTLAAYNVFNAAVALGLERVVWASSETVYGYPFDAVVPDYAPIDEQHPYAPQSSYAISKLVGETMAVQFSRLSRIPFIGLQFSNVIWPPIYEQFPSFWADPKLRIFDLWSYIDCRDAAQAVGLSLTAKVSGADVFIIAADDTVMNRPSAELMAEYFPATRLLPDLGMYQSLMSSAKAKSVLGYHPQHSWRDHVPPQAGG
jgi:nucleoside-diphosphate-sugar epimerase